MKKTSAALMALPLVASLLLAGCSGSAKPDPSSSNTTSSSPSSTAEPRASASATTKVSPKTDPNIPAAARAHTTSGAEAFVRYFYTQMNIAWSRPQTGLISSLSSATCRTCAALEGSSADLTSKHQHYRGDVFAVRTVASVSNSEILVDGEQPPGAVIDSNGSVVRSRTNAQKSKFVISVAWTIGGWRVHEMKVLK